MSGGGLAAAWELAVVFLVRPLLAVVFVFTLILLSWYVAWRTVLVHVPLVQEIAGLRPKKAVKPKPANRGRIAKFYQSQAEAAAQRAKYIVGTAKELQGKPGEGEKWLASLREKELPEVIEALCTLPGVGPKVAACIALFSLDQSHAIPVDTHFWKEGTEQLLHWHIGFLKNPAENRNPDVHMGNTALRSELACSPIVALDDVPVDSEAPVVTSSISRICRLSLSNVLIEVGLRACVRRGECAHVFVSVYVCTV
ncbi:unnamed protein product [Urochloa humidicola]